MRSKPCPLALRNAIYVLKFINSLLSDRERAPEESVENVPRGA